MVTWWEFFFPDLVAGSDRIRRANKKTPRTKKEHTCDGRLLDSLSRNASDEQAFVTSRALSLFFGIAVFFCFGVCLRRR